MPHYFCTKFVLYGHSDFEGGNYLSRWLHTQDYLRQKLSPCLVKKIWPYLHIHFKAPLITRNESIFVLLIEKLIIQGLVSSMHFRFPFHLPVLFNNYYSSEINMLKSCWPIHFQIISPTFQKDLIRCATLKRFAAFAPISFVVQWNVIPNDNIQSFQLSFELHF